MKQTVEQEQWSIAASSWNSFVTHLLADARLKHVLADIRHTITGQGTEKSMIPIRRQQERRAGKHHRLQKQHPLIPCNTIPASTTPLSQYERDQLLLLAASHCDHINAIVHWEHVSSLWIVKYYAEFDSGKADHILPRNKDVLKAQFHHITHPGREHQREQQQQQCQQHLLHSLTTHHQQKSNRTDISSI